MTEAVDQVARDLAAKALALVDAQKLVNDERWSQAKDSMIRIETAVRGTNGRLIGGGAAFIMALIGIIGYLLSQFVLVR